MPTIVPTYTAAPRQVNRRPDTQDTRIITLKPLLESECLFQRTSSSVASDPVLQVRGKLSELLAVGSILCFVFLSIHHKHPSR